MRIKIISLFLLIILLLQACIEPKYIEKLGIINVRGIDIIEEGEEPKIEATIVPYIFDAQSDQIAAVLSGVGYTIKEAREEAGKQTSHTLSPGQIRLELYGSEVAQKGILPFINTLVRDARVSDTMFLAVAEDKAKEIIETQTNDYTIGSTQHLYNLIRKEIALDIFPEPTIHNFSHMVEEVGIDPTLPRISMIDGKPEITGSGIFNKDQLADIISINQTFLINLIHNKIRRAPTNATIPTEALKEYIIYENQLSNATENRTHLYLEVAKAKNDIVLKDFNQLHYEINITMDVDMLESSIVFSVEDEKAAVTFSKELAKYYKQQYEELFSIVQEANSDVFGLGKIYNSNKRGGLLKEEEWEEKYPETTVDFDIKINLRNFGTIE